MLLAAALSAAAHKDNEAALRHFRRAFRLNLKIIPALDALARDMAAGVDDALNVQRQRVNSKLLAPKEM
jgi:hypothetical protein